MKAGVPGLRGLAALLTAATWILIGAAGGVTPAAADGCPNEAIRAEQGALGLPGCRAYELVTAGAQVVPEGEPARAASGGGAITYFTLAPAPDAATSSFFYLAKRGSSGWSVHSVGPQNAAAAGFTGFCEPNVFFSPDLSANILESGWFEEGGSHCKGPVEPLVAGEPELYRNVLVHDVGSGAYQLVNVTPSGAAPENAWFQDAADDLSRVVFSEHAQLTPGAPAGANNLYIWSGGEVRLLTYLPNGTPASGQLVEAPVHSTGLAPVTGATSSDGRRAFFYSGGNLYLRENADQPQSAVGGGECTEPLLACTIQVDASQGPGASGGGLFWRATHDGSSVFFTAASKLTPDSTAETSKHDLYRYDVDSRQLTDLTVNAGEAADVRGVSGMGEDGSYLYFVANGALAPGATPGDCKGAFPAPGHCNLYVLHDGAISFVARLSAAERFAWQEGMTGNLTEKWPRLWANASPSGRFLAFLSYESLTGYDNIEAESGEATRQIFLYDAAANEGAGELSCVSCPPGPPHDRSLDLPAAGSYAGAIERASWMTRSVLDDGSVFFSSKEALASTDTNGREDVYEYRDGEVSLLSDGNFLGPSHFLDASADGRDVFFRTPQALVGHDTDNENVSIYAARRGGGFAEPAAPAVPCEAEGCRGSFEPAPILSLPRVAAPGKVTRGACRPRRRANRARGSRCNRQKRRRSPRRRRHAPPGEVKR